MRQETKNESPGIKMQLGERESPRGGAIQTAGGGIVLGKGHPTLKETTNKAASIKATSAWLGDETSQYKPFYIHY